MSEIIIEPEKKPDFITIKELDGRANVVFACIIDPDSKVMQFVVNTTEEGRLWTSYHRLEDTIRFILQKCEQARQAQSIQAVPASVLSMLEGNR